MKIEVLNDSLSVSRGDDLKTLSMVVHQGAEIEAALAAADAGFVLDDGHAMVSIDYLRATAQPLSGGIDDWMIAFEKMIAYADSHGWVQDGNVRVHIERAG